MSLKVYSKLQSRGGPLCRLYLENSNSSLGILVLVLPHHSATLNSIFFLLLHEGIGWNNRTLDHFPLPDSMISKWLLGKQLPTFTEALILSFTPKWRLGVFKFGGVEGKEGGQEGENKVQGQSKPRLWFPVCPGNGVFPSFRARVLLVPLLRITINIINNGCAPHNPKVQRYLATKVS